MDDITSLLKRGPNLVLLLTIYHMSFQSSFKFTNHKGTVTHKRNKFEYLDFEIDAIDDGGFVNIPTPVEPMWPQHEPIKPIVLLQIVSLENHNYSMASFKNFKIKFV